MNQKPACVVCSSVGLEALYWGLESNSFVVFPSCEGVEFGRHPQFVGHSFQELHPYECDDDATTLKITLFG
jgi:hypothetical protein